MIAAPVAALGRWPAASPALAWPGGQLDYGQLRERVETLAVAAAALGPPGSPLAIVTGSRIALAVGVLAALRLGRPALALEPGRPDLDACLAACGPGGVLDPENPPAVAGTAVETPGFRGPALLVPTSGTTGAARVAMLAAEALDAHVAASAAVLPALGPGDRWLVCLPMSTVGALAALWRCLSAGACLALLERFDPGAARGLMAEGASHVSVVPAMLEPLAASAAAPATGLRCLLSGGGPLTARAAHAALAEGWPLWTGWGMTETASHVAAGPVDEHWQEGVAGRPLPGITLSVTTGGRLAIAGPTLMSGYARPGLSPGEGLAPEGSFVSGDLGESLADGRIRILGRADDVIVTGGVNVHPEAVEAVLGRCEGVDDVGVTARPDERWGMRLVAVYSGAATPDALDRWARAHLPSASRPRVFLRASRLPRNALGKLLRGELRQLGLEAEPGTLRQP
jgi:o-succinylbenzoate---CoA ligase